MLYALIRENGTHLEINVMINDSRGFTLIEFLVAIVILTVGLLGMLTCINLAVEKNLDNIFRTEAVILADDRMMQKRSRAFAALSTTVSNPPKIAISRHNRGVFKNYSVQEIISQSTDHSKEITINVTWKRKNTTSSHSISSAVSSF
jgi:type IV pilus assembly protein PilV